MILEGIVTSWNEQRDVNVAPMGPVVDESMSTLQLRPFQTSQTFRNLKRHPFGVFHVIDDVLLIARAAVEKLTPQPETFPAETIDGVVLKSACRWYEFEITAIDESQKRCSLVANVVHQGRIRDFFGFNRAKHAVLEAAILATRLHILPRDDVQEQLQALRIPVEKTAGPREREAFDFLTEYIDRFDSKR